MFSPPETCQEPKSTRVNKSKSYLDVKIVDSDHFKEELPRNSVSQSLLSQDVLLNGFKPDLSLSAEGDRIFKPTVCGSLITQLGTGPLSRRIFVIRSPTRLTENIVTHRFAQTRYTDLIKLLDRLNTCADGRNTLFLKKNASASVDRELFKSFWPRVLIWDLPINRPGLAAEFLKLKKLVLTFRLLDIGSPSLKFVTSLCNSILFWLYLTNHSRHEETYAIISYYEANPIFLAILGCILIVTDSNGSYPMDLSHISNVLSAASAFVTSHGSKYKDEHKGDDNIHPSVYAMGVLSWVSMNSWNGSSIRLLNRFNTLASCENQPLTPITYKLKSIFVNNFIGPLSGFVIEIYSVNDVNIVDGQIQRDPVTHQVLLYRYTPSVPRDQVEGEVEGSDISSPPGSSSIDTTDFFDTVYGCDINLNPWEYWKHQQAESCMNYSCRSARLKCIKKKKSFTQRTVRATKRFFKSIRSSGESKGDHLLGVSGCAMKNTIREDLSMQFQLIADRNNYSLVVEEIKEDKAINVVLDYLNPAKGEDTSSGLPSLSSAPVGNQMPVTLCGDILIVVRQESPQLVKYNIDKQRMENATKEKNEKSLGTSLSIARRPSSLVSTLTPLATSSSSRLLSPYDHSKSIFAAYSFHTGFFPQGTNSLVAEIFHITYQDFDILDSQKEFVPTSLEMCLVCECLKPNMRSSVKPPSMNSTDKPDVCKTTHPNSTSPAGASVTLKHSNNIVTRTCSNYELSKDLDEPTVIFTSSDRKPFLSPYGQGLEDRNTCINFSSLKIDRDIESFLRYHPVKPNESYLLSFLKEGYSLFASVLALKITNNDAWNSLQFFLRLPQLDSREPNCMTDARCMVQDGITNSLFRMGKVNFDFNKRFDVVSDFFDKAIPPTPDELKTMDTKAHDVFPDKESPGSSTIPVAPFLQNNLSATSSPDENIQAKISYPEIQSNFELDQGVPLVSSQDKVSLQEPIEQPHLKKAIVTHKKILHVERVTTIAEEGKSCLKNGHGELRRRPLPPPPPIGLLKQTKPPPLGRKIFWKPLQASNIQGTVFEQLSEKPIEASQVVDVSSMVDSNHLSRLFSKKAARTLAIVKKSSPAENQKVCLFSAKRAQNLSIILARITVSISSVVDAVHLMKRGAVSIENLEKIESCFLSIDEDQAFTEFLKQGGITTQLREVPEQKLLGMRPSNTFRLAESIAILKFMDSYKSVATSLSESLHIIDIATGEVRKSQRFRQLLSVILRWGNYINYGISQGDLYIRGFTLGSLLKLTEFKTIIDNKITALHYLAANLLTNAPEMSMERLNEDMPSLKDAAKISSEGLNYSLTLIKQGSSFLKSESKHNKECLRTDTFSCISEEILLSRIEQLESFERECDPIVTAIEAEYLRVKQAAYETARFFGDDIAHQSEFDKSFPQENFFGTLANFVTKFNACSEELLGQPGKLDALLGKDSPSPILQNNRISIKKAVVNEVRQLTIQNSPSTASHFLSPNSRILNPSM